MSLALSVSPVCFQMPTSNFLGFAGWRAVHDNIKIVCYMNEDFIAPGRKQPALVFIMLISVTSVLTTKKLI